MITIEQGNVYQTTATFTDEAGSPIDPTTVSLVYAFNGDVTTKTTLLYAGGTTPAPGLVVRTAVGVYVGQIDLTHVSGTVQRYWESTGVGQAASAVDGGVIPALPF